MKTPKIVIIEDNPVHITILRSILCRGYNITVAANGLSGLDLVKQQAPDLILLDIYMPEMDGLEVCRLLKDDAVTKDIPIIFLTGDDTTETQTKAFDLGAVDFIKKPIHAKDVLARVKIHTSLRKLTTGLEKKNKTLSDDYQQIAMGFKELQATSSPELTIKSDKKTSIDAQKSSRFNTDLLSLLFANLTYGTTATYMAVLVIAAMILPTAPQHALYW